MTPSDPSARHRFTERYADRDVPWDHPEPPPEVIEFAATLPPGRALDLGCGYGRAAIYLARQGWQADGVDFVDAAIAEAEARAREAGVADRTRFMVGSVASLDEMPVEGPYDLALDVGCMHRMEEAGIRQCHRSLLNLLQPGSWFLLFAHLHDPDNPSEDDRAWLDEDLLLSVFEEGFELVRVEHGITQVGDKAPWPSGWFWFRRLH